LCSWMHSSTAGRTTTVRGLDFFQILDKTHKMLFYVSMKTNVDLDENLVLAARELTGLKTKKELVNHALSELVRRGDQKKILALQGKILWQGNLAEMRTLRT